MGARSQPKERKGVCLAKAKWEKGRKDLEVSVSLYFGLEG